MKIDLNNLRLLETLDIYVLPISEACRVVVMQFFVVVFVGKIFLNVVHVLLVLSVPFTTIVRLTVILLIVLLTLVLNVVLRLSKLAIVLLLLL